MSIVIVSAEGFAVSGRRVSDGHGERGRPADKVFANDDMIVGSVGMFLSVRKLRRHMGPEGLRNPDEVVDLIDEDSCALACYKGRLYEIDDEGAEEIPEKVHAVGSGAHAALGFLAGRGSATLEDCKAAVKFACTLRSDCGDGVKVVRSKY